MTSKNGSCDNALADVLARIADTPQTKLAELLPWNSPAEPLRQKAA